MRNKCDVTKIVPTIDLLRFETFDQDDKAKLEKMNQSHIMSNKFR